jgi:adenosine deaminase
MARGLSFATIFDGLRLGIEKHIEISRFASSKPITVKFIVSLVGERDANEAKEIVEQAV